MMVPMRTIESDNLTVGGCSFCTDHVTLHPPGVRDHRVLVVRREGGGVEVRMCRACAKAIRPALASFAR